MTRRPAARTLLALPAGVALVVGIDAGLSLLEAWPPLASGRLGDIHGILMVLGFVGTLIALERAVALGRPWGYVSPALLGAGALLLILPDSSLGTTEIGSWLIPTGSLALCLLYIPLWRRQCDDAVLISALGAVCALGGAVLWRGGAGTSQCLPWLAGFVILTIVGERLELARLAMLAHAGRDLLLLSTSVCLAIPAATLWPAIGAPILGLAVLALVAWLVTHDVARRTVTGVGFPRFAAACILCGQAWLAIAGGIWLVAGSTVSGRAYDAVVHAVFLGFTISMIMAHAPTILPAVTRVALPYRPEMYVALALLQASLLVRVWGGDAMGNEFARRIGGMGNAIALVVFLLVAVASAARGASAPVAPPAVSGHEVSA